MEAGLRGLLNWSKHTVKYNIFLKVPLKALVQRNGKMIGDNESPGISISAGKLVFFLAGILEK